MASCFAQKPFRHARTGAGRERPPRDIGMLRDAGQLLRDLRRRQNKIHTARRDRASRHRVVFGRFILREGDSALGFDRLQPQGAVGRRAGKITPMAQSFWSCASDSRKKSIERCGRVALRARLEFQHPRRDRQVGVGRNHIDAIGRDPQIICHLVHRHRRGPREQMRQRAFVLRIEMLHEDKSHPRIRRQMFEQLGEASSPPADAPTPTIGN